MKRFLVVLAVLALTSTTYAQDADPRAAESGFSAQASLGAVFTNVKNNLIPSSFFGSAIAEKRLDSLYRKPKGSTVIQPIIDLNLRYTLPTTQTQLFVATWNSEIDDLNGFQGGFRQGLGHIGSVELGFLYTIPSDVWADPYITGAERKETSRGSYGARLSWEEAFGSELQLQYTLRRITIDREESGTFFGLTPGDAGRLQRTGYLHQAEIGYPFMFMAGGMHRLTPALRYTREDLQGEAMSAHTYEVKLSYAYFTGPFGLMLDGSAGVSLHDKRNPIFQKLQEDTRYSASITFSYQTPFGWTPFGLKNWGPFATTGYAAADSNIDFYSKATYHLGAGLSLSL